ncbi:hypothetical protein CYMTET_33700 [Cymbomonas tetramitiformis]|uniref:Uncharacterized protein n=1 Tax=Cymbomonas tetramitiformis TaxID=36881 RepID=A0AAE0FCR6_9CHLO|nr:hypothetical protein CYMTET_33700 [Cymbomonas tetramitiformis]
MYERIAQNVRSTAKRCLQRAGGKSKELHPLLFNCEGNLSESSLDKIYDLLRCNTSNAAYDVRETTESILQESARRQRTIVPFADHEARTEYLTRHLPLKRLTSITAEQVQELGLREHFPGEHGDARKVPTPAQYTMMCLLLSFENRDVVVSSHKLKNVNSRSEKSRWPDPTKPAPVISFSEDRRSGMNFDIVTAPPGTGKTGVTIEAALALYRGILLPRILRRVDAWSVQIRATSVLGLYRADAKLRAPRPCQLLVVVAPDNVMTYWHKTLANAVAGDDDFTIYPAAATNKLYTDKLAALIDEHTHDAAEYKQMSLGKGSKTLVLRLSPLQLKEFLSRHDNIAWPLTIFDEFSAHCASMGVNTPIPLCRLFWAISATPTEICSSLNNCSTQNPFKMLVGAQFKTAESDVPKTDDWVPKHWPWKSDDFVDFDRPCASLKMRTDLLTGNAQVLLLTTFSQCVIDAVIKDVSSKMPKGVHFVTGVTRPSDGTNKYSSWRLHAFDANWCASSNIPDGFRLYDLTVAAARYDPTTSCTLLDKVFIADVQLHIDFKAVIVRWFPLGEHESFVRLTAMRDHLDRAINRAKTIAYPDAQLSRRVISTLSEKREFISDEITDLDSTLVCTRCGGCVRLTSPAHTLWVRLHSDAATRTMLCPFCYTRGKLSGDLNTANPMKPADVHEAAAYLSTNFTDILKQGGYANSVHATMSHYVLNEGARRILLFADVAPAMPFLRSIFASLTGLFRQRGLRFEHILLNDAEGRTAGQSKQATRGAVIDMYQAPSIADEETVKVLLLNVHAGRNEETHGMNLDCTDCIVAISRIPNPVQAVHRALRAGDAVNDRTVHVVRV